MMPFWLLFEALLYSRVLYELYLRAMPSRLLLNALLLMRVL